MGFHEQTGRLRESRKTAAILPLAEGVSLQYGNSMQRIRRNSRILESNTRSTGFARLCKQINYEVDWNFQTC